MKIHPNPVLTQPVLILLLILLVAGTNSYLLTEAQNTATTMISVNNASSSTNRPMNNTIDSTLPKLGMIDAKIKCSQLAKMDFSLKREIFFVVLDALLGDIMMILPGIIYRLFYENGNYYTIWIIFGHVSGVYSNFTIYAGIAIHFLTAFSIGIVLGIFLYKTGILEISKPLNGLFYGLFTGTVVFLLWSVPVQQLILNHATEKNIALMNPSMSHQTMLNNLQKNLITSFLQNFVRNLIFGITLGLTTSLLSINLGNDFNVLNVAFLFQK